MKPRVPLWYEVLWRVALPFALLRIWWRGRREPGYRLHVGERFGRYVPVADARPAIWIHAVSVGETRAAEPLVRALRERYPDHRIVLSHMTATGRETGRTLFGDRVTQAYLPYDTSFATERFLAWSRPRMGLLMETELWPNLILRARNRGIPVFLVNARLSDRSARRYRRLPQFTQTILRSLAGVAAQTAADGERLQALGATRLVVTGNVKFDVAVPDDIAQRCQQLRGMLGAVRPVWVLGSTRDGEEALLLDALLRLPLPPAALVVIVPRHPQRFDAVAALLEQRRMTFVRKSDEQPVPAHAAVVLGDTMGEMLSYYAAADVAFIGGTLLPLGGQNLIEPLAVGTPVLIGPSTFNFAEVAREALAQGAARSVADAGAAVEAARALLLDSGERAQMSAAGRRLLSAHSGATRRTVEWIGTQLDTGATSPR
ncbi:MAG: lipid IV(A) 3-deoxy-D-manno-octulosonic acid transferase [Betaproteobacteria bacterium]